MKSNCKARLPYCTQLGWALFSMSLAGCAHHYGGNIFPVNFSVEQTSPAPTLYAIPDQVWTMYPDQFDSKKTAAAELNERLMQYRIDNGKKELDSITYDIVIQDDNGQLTAIKQITPHRPDETVTVTKAELLKK
jgi:hypothetical protein